MFQNTREKPTHTNAHQQLSNKKMDKKGACQQKGRRDTVTFSTLVPNLTLF
jgi:hypothetical protein